VRMAEAVRQFNGVSLSVSISVLYFAAPTLGRGPYQRCHQEMRKSVITQRTTQRKRFFEGQPVTVTLSDRAGPPLVIRLFGSFEVCRDGKPLPPLRTRKGQWLLALLALRAGQEVERAWLAGTLWPDSSEARALANLRNSLTDLRGALGPEEARLRSPTPHTLCLELAGAEVDVVAFDAAIAPGDSEGGARAGEGSRLRERVGGGHEAALERAVALYRGPLLEGCTEGWAFQERQIREQAYLAALETLAAHALAHGDAAAAERHLRRAVAVDPLRDTAQRALMHALAAAGNYAAALTAYRDLRLRLHREMNAEPDPETQALLQQIRAEARVKTDAETQRRREGSGASARPALSVAPSSRRPVAPPRLPPEGTVTFLFTDIEGSTRLWEEHPAAMPEVLSRHNDLLQRAIEAYEGHLFKTMGDQCCAAFSTAADALAAALAAQRALAAEGWGPVGTLRVRMALHTGAVEARDGDYLGAPLNRVARLLAAAHGGQILVSLAAAELVREQLPEGASLRDLGASRLRDLIRPEQIFQLVAPGLPADFPPLRSLEAFPHNLPLQLTSFIGREDQMAELEQLLTDHRLVTLTGAGGCGKTRLALQMAAELLETFPDGVWFVDLAPLADPELVPQTVATVLGLQEAPGPPPAQRLQEYLKPRQLLLMLDNCEHLIEACAQLVHALLQGCPRLRVLATSREALGIAGERSYRVPPLSLPDSRRLPTLEQLTQYEAVRLFMERAVAVLPSFQVTDENARALAEVCHRLDGIPLALELAAARVRALPVEKINERLDDMFRLLTGGSRTALPRQQTLRALIDWSYDLLSEPERALLRRMSVFSGGWNLEAAEAVCSDDGIEEWEVLDLLTSLVEKSLVVCEGQDVETRYWLLETVRQYSRDRLLEAAAVDTARERHRDFFLQLAERAETKLRGSEQLVWLPRLDREHNNMRAALEWCESADGDGEAGLRLATALWWFWIMRNHFSEGRQWLEAALSRGHGVSPSLRARALAAAANLAGLGGDGTAAERYNEEALRLARETGEQWVVAWVPIMLGIAATNREDGERATLLGEESLATARAVGDRWLIAASLLLQGRAARVRGDYEAATKLLAESLALLREVGDRWWSAIALINLGAMATARDDYEQAAAFAREGLALCREMADKRGIVWCIHTLAQAAAGQGRSERTVRLLGAADALREASAIYLPLPFRTTCERTLEEARAALGEEAYAAAWAVGRAMPLEQAIVDALAD
jgi:predicted ATPase/class 3 adenylate cyclase/two-component SAPR family response regulator